MKSIRKELPASPRWIPRKFPYLCICCEERSKITFPDHLLCRDCWRFSEGRPKRIRRLARRGSEFYLRRLVEYTRANREATLKAIARYQEAAIEEFERRKNEPLRVAIRGHGFIPLCPGHIEVEELALGDFRPTAFFIPDRGRWDPALWIVGPNGESVQELRDALKTTENPESKKGSEE